MTSSALAAWRASRLPRLDQLLATHPEAPGSSTDPALAEVWTQALVLRLASEFQGFCRELHNNGVEAILGVVTTPASGLRGALLTGLTAGRGLDRRSADPRTIGADFARFGLDLWTALAVGHARLAPLWRESLRHLNTARNGVVHADADALAAVEASGWPVHFGSVQRWRNLLDEIATAVDAVLNRHIAELIGKNPWEDES